jgi:putative membrane protein
MCLATEDSLNDSMERATKHYSSLFFLPSLEKTLIALGIVCIGILGTSATFVFFSVDGVIRGFSLGLSTFGLTLLCDFLLTRKVLSDDLIFVMRRAAALSLFCWILWLPFLIIGTLVGGFVGIWLWIDFCLLGYSAVLTLRAVVFLSISISGFSRGALATLLQPLFCVVPFLVYWAVFLQVNVLSIGLFLFVASFLGLACGNLLVSQIDRLGQKVYGISAISLFRAFMLNWTLGVNEPIEEYFEKLGDDKDVEVSLLRFESIKTKAAFVVPMVHPGPFKNLGSSLLPSKMKYEFQRAFGGDACVPLGILGHELDLASQSESQKIIDSVLMWPKQVTLSEGAKPFVKVKKGDVTVCCQVFGNVAMVSFSLAPKTTEDLPQELGHFVREEARKRGLQDAIVINAHNSITDVASMEESVETLKTVASECLSKAVSAEDASLEIGASSLYPKDFDLKDGMGDGGITTVAVKVDGQKTAYVVIDGNNMISGLREKILDALKTLGFDEGEVFTTDTHSVNALILGRRGYHPVGEVMSHDLLLRHVKQASLTAINRLEFCKTFASTVTVPKIRVIGKARIEGLSALIDQALQKAKRVVVPLFGLEGLLLILLLVVL